MLVTFVKKLSSKFNTSKLRRSPQSIKQLSRLFRKFNSFNVSRSEKANVSIVSISLCEKLATNKLLSVLKSCRLNTVNLFQLMSKVWTLLSLENQWSVSVNVWVFEIFSSLSCEKSLNPWSVMCNVPTSERSKCWMYCKNGFWCSETTNMEFLIFHSFYNSRLCHS